MQIDCKAKIGLCRSIHIIEKDGVIEDIRTASGTKKDFFKKGVDILFYIL